MTQDSVADTSKRLNSISFAVLTDPGRKREENQDAFGAVEGHLIKVFMVADGMGGARGGAIASSLAIDLIKSSFRGQEEISCAEISSVIAHANKAIQEKGTLDLSLSGMGTTLVGIAFDAKQAFVFNVGDSRLYRLTKNNFSLVTEDHTLVQELLRSGAIEPEQAKNHPVSHMLTRSLGPSADVKVDCFKIEDGLFCGEKFLICSDGLHNQASSAELESILRNHTKEEAVKLLVDLANERGGPDNITVMIVELGEDFPVDTSVSKESLESAEEALPNVAETLNSNHSEDDSNFVSKGSDSASDNISGNLLVPPKNNKKVLMGIIALLLVAVCSAFVVLLFAFLHSTGESERVSLPALVEKNDSEIARKPLALADTAAKVALSSESNGSSELIIPTTTATIRITNTPIQIASGSSLNQVVVATAVAPQVAMVTPSVATSSLLIEKSSESAVESDLEKLDVQALVASGEKAIKARQAALKEKISFKGEQLGFIRLPEEGRNLRLQALNDSKTSLLSQRSLIENQISTTKASVAESQKLLADAATVEPIGMARRLSNRFPEISARYKNFEVATDQYLKALENRRASPQSPESASALEAALTQRTQSVGSLKAGLESELSQTLNQQKEQLMKLEADLSDLEKKQTENDQQRMELSTIANISKSDDLAAIETQINQDLLKLKNELALLTK